MAAAEAERAVRRLPDAREWILIGIVDTGRGLVDVRHVSHVAPAEAGEPVGYRDRAPATGILRTSNGIVYVFRPWLDFLADYYAALHYPRPT